MKAKFQIWRKKNEITKMSNFCLDLRTLTELQFQLCVRKEENQSSLFQHQTSQPERAHHFPVLHKWMNSQNEVAEELLTRHAILESSRAFYSILLLYSVPGFSYWMKFSITEGDYSCSNLGGAKNSSATYFQQTCKQIKCSPLSGG